jgi:hypothetical protein
MQPLLRRATPNLRSPRAAAFDIEWRNVAEVTLWNPEPRIHPGHARDSRGAKWAFLISVWSRTSALGRNAPVADQLS